MRVRWILTLLLGLFAFSGPIGCSLDADADDGELEIEVDD
jgi:hypothetical protein